MKKRIISFATALTVIISLFGTLPIATYAVTTSAAEKQIGYSLNAPQESHSHSVCGQTCTHDGTDNHKAESYTALTQASFTGGTNGEPADGSGVTLSSFKENYILDEGSYYLSEDITVDKPININHMLSDSPTVNLCLNGHTLTSTVTENNQSIFLGKVTFNLCDCKSGGSIQSQARYLLNVNYKNMSIANLYGGTLTSVNRCVVVYNSLTLDGAVLKSDTEYSIDAQGGSSVNIKSGSAESGGSSSVVVFTNDFTMTGGQILHTGNYEAALEFAHDSGGNISGGTIKSDKGYGISLVSIPLTLSGSPVIKGKDADIAFFNDGLVTVSNDLNGTYSVLQLNWWVSDGPNSKYEITEDNPFTFTIPADTDHSAHFTASAKMTGIAVRNIGTGSNQQVQLYLHSHTGGTATCNQKKVCEICGVEYGNFAAHTLTKTEAVDPTCTSAGNDAYWTCSVCNKMFSDGDGKTEITQIPTIFATGHKFAEDWTSNDTHHWHAAICGHTDEVDGKAEHTWNDGIVTTEPTEETAGVKTYTCTVCNYEKTEPIATLEHTHNFVSHAAVSATCTTNGNEAYWTCSGCDKIFSDENGTTEIDDVPTIPATGHNFSTGWTYDDTHHWHAAVCVHTDEIDGKAAHIFVDGKCTVCQKSDPSYSKPTDTEPTVTEPPVTDPSGTDPTVTEPPVTDPSDTEPIVTQPPVTEPPITEPTATAPPVTEPIVTNPPYSPYFQSNNAPAVYASIEPFLQNENGKIGWDVISDNIWETPDGETVLVNMNGTTKLPKNIVSDISGRDIDLVLIMNRSFTWTINGMSVTKAKNVDMNVRKISKIPKSTVREIFGDAKTVQLDLRHNGDFGFIAELTIDLGNRYDGMYANSYCCKSRKFEFGDSGEIVNGQANLRFSHASSWLITIESFPVLEDVSSAAAAHSSGTPIDMSNSTSRGITVPDFDFEKKLRLSNKKRRYRILKKRRLDDLVFVL